MADDRSRVGPGNNFWQIVCPPENVVLIDLKLVVNSTQIQQTLLLSKAKEHRQKGRCWKQFVKVGPHRGLDFFFKGNKSKNMVPSLLKAVIQTPREEESTFDVLFSLIYSGNVYWWKITFITRNLHVLMLPLYAGCGSRMLARKYHILQSLTAFLATGRTVTIPGDGGSKSREPASCGSHCQQGALGHPATALSPAEFNEVKCPQDASMGNCIIVKIWTLPLLLPTRLPLLHLLPLTEGRKIIAVFTRAHENCRLC